MGFQGDREALHTGDRLPASFQGKFLNLLLGIGDGVGRRSRLTIFSREISQPPIRNR